MTDTLNFKTEAFEGPLDLLLTLIAKHKLDIRDIEISVLTEQFLLYISAMQEADIDIAGEFLEMAARLILIKTATLLPKHEVEEMKKELEGALIEYAMCKAAAERLKRHFVGYDIFVREPLDIPVDNTYHNIHDPYELLDAYRIIDDKSKLSRKSELHMKPIVAPSYISVFTKIVYVLRRIQYAGAEVEVKSLYRGQSRSAQVATFLALLELSKYNRVRFSEDGMRLEFVGRSAEETNETEENTENGLNADDNAEVENNENS